MADTQEPSMMIYGPQSVRREYTVKEYAAHERVHEITVRRWIEKGAVMVRRTPGGGVRIVEPT